MSVLKLKVIQTKNMETIKIGDIVEHTGGYNCTQTQFYLVKGFNKSGKKAFIVSLGKDQVSGDWMNGAVAPNLEKQGDEVHEVMVKTDYSNRPILRGRINSTVYDKETGAVKWVNRGPVESFRVWNGKPAWNNCD